MTVGELIAKLTPHDPGARAVLPGYESGVDDIQRITPIGIQVRKAGTHPDYDGRHIPVKQSSETGEYMKPISEVAVLIEGRHSTLP